MTLGVAAPANAGIQLYQFANYDTYLGDFGTGTSYVGSFAQNKTTSFKVNGVASYAILHQYSNWSGAYTGTFYNGWSNLAYYAYWTSDGNNFDNRTSSIS